VLSNQIATILVLLEAIAVAEHMGT